MKLRDRIRISYSTLILVDELADENDLTRIQFLATILSNALKEIKK
ncbi:hypothetical protein [Lonsdalea britannica]|nr:hypothetical protein [Lonsdalea britannica]